MRRGNLERGREGSLTTFGKAEVQGSLESRIRIGGEPLAAVLALSSNSFDKFAAVGTEFFFGVHTVQFAAVDLCSCRRDLLSPQDSA